MKTQNLEAFRMLNDLKNKGFVTLLSLSAEDLGLNTDTENRFKLVYTLYNPVNKEFKEIEVTTNDEFPSVCTLYKSANYDEREIYDLFGIKFKNHPNLKRIFLPENFEGHPLRKDYKCTNSNGFRGSNEAE